MKIKWIFRIDPVQRLVRIARILWKHGTPGMPGGGYSAKLSLALDSHIFGPRRRPDNSGNDWRITLLGIRIHYQRSYGGIIV